LGKTAGQQKSSSSDICVYPRSSAVHSDFFFHGKTGRRLVVVGPIVAHLEVTPRFGKVGSARCADPAGASPVSASGILEPPAGDRKARAGTPQPDVPTL